MVKKTILAVLVFNMLCCEQIIEVEDISNESVIILAPTDNATIDSTSVNFTWKTIEFSETYQLQIARPNFEAPQEFLEDTIITSNSFIKSLPSNTYQWRIKAMNFSYETAFTTQNLNIED